MRCIGAVLGLGLIVALGGCAPGGESAAPVTAGAATSTEAQDAAAMAADPRLVVVHKNETCGCCHSWVEHLQKHGFRVVVRDIDNLGPIKEKVGVPAGMGSCHTGEVGGYFIEGHVPAAEIARLLDERPDARGLTVPGMPAGSPGMEVPSGEVQPYDVHLIGRDGTSSVYAHYGGT